MARSFRHVILDRDGVLNRERAGQWVLTPGDWEWEDGSLSALAALCGSGIEVSVVSNQSCVGRGLARDVDVRSLHAWVVEEAHRAGGRIERILYCPHTPAQGCACRKPRPGLVVQAMQASGIAADETLLVGDDMRDLEAAHAAGVTSILTRTGKGRSVEALVPPSFRASVSESLQDAVADLVMARSARRIEVKTRKAFDEHSAVLDACKEQLAERAAEAAALIARQIAAGGKVLAFGNGGSAADAQHFAAELVGRFVQERRGFPAIALGTDGSALTAIGNDYSFELVFARQVEALARAGDVAVAISTSGSSKNVVCAARRARDSGCLVIAVTGGSGGELKEACDLLVAVPSSTVARIQEMHGLFLHAVAEAVEARLVADEHPRSVR